MLQKGSHGTEFEPEDVYIPAVPCKVNTCCETLMYRFRVGWYQDSCKIKLNLSLSLRAIWETSWCISWSHHNLWHYVWLSITKAGGGEESNDFFFFQCAFKCFSLFLETFLACTESCYKDFPSSSPPLQPWGLKDNEIMWSTVNVWTALYSINAKY